MRESEKSDWRKDLENLEDGGDHPYVEVMPTTDNTERAVKKAKKKKEDKETESEMAPGKESIQDDPEHQKNFKAAADSVAKGMADRRKKLDLSKFKAGDKR